MSFLIQTEGGTQSDQMQTEPQNTLKQRRRQWTGDVILPRKKGQNLFLMERMVRFRILIVMVMTLALQKTGNIKVI